MAGEFPNVAKLVAIAAPHSSNMDVVWGLLFKYGLRLNVQFIGKREAFFWPLGSLLRHLRRHPDRPPGGERRGRRNETRIRNAG